jgi:hypothetical protein
MVRPPLFPSRSVFAAVARSEDAAAEIKPIDAAHARRDTDTTPVSSGVSMMRCLLLALIALATLSGCASHDKPRRPDAITTIRDAQSGIDRQRLIKRRLLEANPIEHAIENYLRADPRIKEARFAILIPDRFFVCIGGMDDSFTYCVAVTAHEPMSPDDAQKLLLEAFAAAGMRRNYGYDKLVVDGNQWGVRWGTIELREDENPDLSALQP